MPQDSTCPSNAGACVVHQCNSQKETTSDGSNKRCSIQTHQLPGVLADVASTNMLNTSSWVCQLQSHRLPSN